MSVPFICKVDSLRFFQLFLVKQLAFQREDSPSRPKELLGRVATRSRVQVLVFLAT